MTGFLWRKLWKNKWLMLCLILGNIILIGVVTAVPLFTTATIQRLLQEDLRYVQETQNVFPAIMRLRYNFAAAPEEGLTAHYVHTRDVLWPQAVEEMGISTYFEFTSYASTWSIRPVEPREVPNRLRSMQLAGIEGFEDNTRLTHGRMPQNGFVDGNIIEVLATDQAMHVHNLILDELLEYYHADVTDRDLFLRVVGIYEIGPGSGPFWSAVPIVFLHNALLTHPGIIYGHFIYDHIPSLRLNVTWTQVMDTAAVRAANVGHYQETAQRHQEFFNDDRGIWQYNISFLDLMGQHTARVERLEITLWVLQAPIYVMLALFMYMVTKQILLLDKNGISVLKSRGASRFQILGVYAYQGLIVGAISFPIGLGLGVVLCHIIGASNGFLDMVNRTALEVEITSTALLYGLIGFAVSFLYMLLPVIKLSRVTIVEHKQRKSGKSIQKPVWQRYFLDIIAFAVSVYVLYNFHNQREIMMTTLPETRAFDPLIFLSSSLFIIGAGLLCLRLYPYLVKLVLFLGRNKFGPSVFASMLKIIRSSGQEQFIMLFLVFTVAVGIFSAQAARTINLNNAHRLQYLAGVDLMIAEHWTDNIPDPSNPFILVQPSALMYTEPDFNRFMHFDQVDSITRVMRRGASLHIGGRSSVNDLTFMAIDTQSFGETVWFRDDLLMIHINYFLNVLSKQPDGVLLSSNFQSELGYEIGDIVNITEEQRFGPPSSGRFVVMGFVDHWPTFSPVETTRLETGEIRQERQFLAVVNHGHIQNTWGVRPYQIWMATNGQSHQFIHDFISENNISVREFHDTRRDLTEMQLDPIVQGTNGVLTISFILTLLLCFTGFLIYWILSIKNRLLQFGVFRAMGMSMRSITGILISEQVLITVSALIIGGVLGEVAARLYVPLLLLSYTAADQVIPLIIVMEPMDYITLYGLLGFMVLLCVTVLVIYNSRVDVSQILKLGED